MKDLKRLTCKICDHKSDNLVEHITSAHASDASIAHADGPLTGYMIKYEVGEDDVVHPEYGVEKESAVADGLIELVPGGKLPKGLGGDYVPQVNSAYHFNEQTLDVVLDIANKKPVMLTGHTGCGKTSLITEIAARTNQGVFRVNLNGQTTIGDFVGLWTVKGGETVWVDGALPKAMREGMWLIIDEYDFGEASILSALHSVLERNKVGTGYKLGSLTLKEKNHEVVVPHPNFRIFSTANTAGCMSQYRGLYQGTNAINEANLDRWNVYHVDYLPAEQEASVLVGSVAKLTPKAAKVIVQVGNLIRESFKKEDIQCTMSLRRLIDWSELMVRHKNPLKAAAPTIFSKVSAEDAKVIEGIIKRVMVGNKDE